ncbi:MAG TPA: hypothetical protein ENJ20_06440 [Bacteroidetes bacterium]|nr:hypothetical protein [Bacteroidota bacterium]
MNLFTLRHRMAIGYKPAFSFPFVHSSDISILKLVGTSIVSTPVCRQPARMPLTDYGELTNLENNGRMDIFFGTPYQ